MIWKPLTEGIYFHAGQRTVCALVAVPDDIVRDIDYLLSTISIIHYRKNAGYADDEAMDKALRVERWLAQNRPLISTVKPK